MCNLVQRLVHGVYERWTNNERQTIIDSNRNEYIWDFYSQNGQNTYSLNTNDNIISNKTMSTETLRRNDYTIIKC